MIQPGNHPHGSRFTGPVRAEETGDDTRLDHEAQPVDRQLLPVLLAEVFNLDHVNILPNMP